tara:strand:- start:1692 stop:1964 length:273 start_codon:yes stop_codon:yes gene_type:complete
MPEEKDRASQFVESFYPPWGQNQAYWEFQQYPYFHPDRESYEAAVRLVRRGVNDVTITGGSSDLKTGEQKPSKIKIAWNANRRWWGIVRE